MRLDIVSDTVCPWCYIGKKKLERAFEARPELDVSIEWRPYQLDPTVPSYGVDRREYMTRKFGGDGRATAIYQNIAEAGSQEQIPFAFEKIQRTPNTLDSHRLIRWAGGVGRQDQVVMDLFSRYFEKGEDIGDPNVLIDVARSAGMDADLVGELLASDADRDEVHEEIDIARSLGVQGVPCFLINNRFMITGAQEPDTFFHAFDRAIELGDEKGPLQFES